MPTTVDGVISFSPEIVGVNESYDPAWYAQLGALEADNFWFVARNRLVKWLAKSFLPRNCHYLELGCGTGYVLQMLRNAFPKWRISASEAQTDGIIFAKNRVGYDVAYFQMDACFIPFRNEFDVIGAFDVIEHIPDDVGAIKQVYAALKPGGYCMLSVPQHMFLWSGYDEVGCHFRRYSVGELERKLKSVGFSVIISTSFNSLLLPLMVISRALKKGKTSEEVDVLDELRLSPVLNVVLSAILWIEFILMQLGVRFPFGGSRVVIAQKPVL